jgi:hypothetical protein
MRVLAVQLAVAGAAIGCIGLTAYFAMNPW